MVSQRQTVVLVRLGLAAGLWLSTALSLGPVQAQEAITSNAAADDTSQVVLDQPAAPTTDVAPAVEVAPVVEAASPVAPAPPPPEVPPATPPTVAPAVPAVAATSVAATVVDNRFQPATLSVTVGTTVTWTNAGTNLHTLTSADGLGLESGALQPGQTFSYTFSQPGTYQLICRQHRLNGMAAKVIVQ